MAKLISTVCLVASIMFCSSQQITNEFITGKWVVDSVALNMEAGNSKQKDALAQMVKGFEKVQFDFKPNGNLDIKYPDGKAPEIFDDLFPPGKQLQWKFSEAERLISIGTSKDYLSLMGFVVSNQGKQVCFSIEETEIKLRVKKM